MRNPIFRYTEVLNPAMKNDNDFDSIWRGERRFDPPILWGELSFYFGRIVIRPYQRENSENSQK